MSKDWDVAADAAIQRRREKNTPWPGDAPNYGKTYSFECKGCGSKVHGQFSYELCNECLKKAYDVLESLEHV